MAVLTQSPFYRQIVNDIEVRKAQELIQEAIDAHFGRVPEDTEEKVKAVSDLERLKLLLRRAVTASTMEEFLEELDAAAEE